MDNNTALLSLASKVLAFDGAQVDNAMELMKQRKAQNSGLATAGSVQVCRGVRGHR